MPSVAAATHAPVDCVSLEAARGRAIAGMTISLDGFLADAEGMVDRLYVDPAALRRTPVREPGRLQPDTRMWRLEPVQPCRGAMRRARRVRRTRGISTHTDAARAAQKVRKGHGCGPRMKRASFDAQAPPL
jgi:hypothetical protein